MGNERTTWERWMMFGLALIIIPSVCWLVSEVLSIRHDFVIFQAKVEERMEIRDEQHKRNQISYTDQQKMIARLDRNVVRMCEKAGVNYEAP